MAPPSAAASSKSFEDLQGDFYKEDIFVRLIHSWEAPNIKKGNVLMGVSKAFIPANRLYRFKSLMKPDTVYKLSNFIVRPAKRLYKVASHIYGISFNDHTSFVEVNGSPLEIAAQKFRIRDFQAFAYIADTAAYLFDIVGHLRLINGEKLHAPTPMSTPLPAGGPSKEMVFKATRKTITVSHIVGDGDTELRGPVAYAEEDNHVTSTEKRSAATVDDTAAGDEESPKTGDKSKRDGKRPRLN